MVESSHDVKYAGFWIRVVAGLLDNIILFIAFIFVLSLYIGLALLIYGQRFYPQQTDNFIIIILMFVLIATNILYYLYFALLQSSVWQATIGMKVCGLKITDCDLKRVRFWRAMGREICTILSGFILYIGYFMIAFTKKKQGLHDMIAETYVVKE
jgi:uncharacterized RDD family membrane protein YckC